MDNNRITLQIEGVAEEKGHVTLSAFLSQLEAVKAALKQTERIITGEEEASVYYRIIDLRHTSPATVVLEAVPFSSRPQWKPKKRASTIREDYSRPVVRRFFHSLRGIREKKERPERSDLQLLQAYRNLSASLQKDVSSVKLTDSDETVDIDRRFQAAIDDIIGPDELLEGTVNGTLERLNLHNTTRFDIFPTIGPKQVTCDFKPELKANVIAAVDRYISVTGKLRYKRLENFPYAINAERIEILPPEDELPTLLDIRGIAPNFTEGKNALEFLKELRDAEEA
jgi:hypothetical protein